MCIRDRVEEELAAYRQRLEKNLRLDHLTQIANRRALNEHVDTEWQRAMRSQTTIGLLMIDVDHFKAYNDHHGHVAVSYTHLDVYKRQACGRSCTGSTSWPCAICRPM